MKTRRFCPHCGRMLYKSRLSKTENKYVFECRTCDEDFYRIEVLTKRDIDKVREIRRIANAKQI